MKIGVDTLPPLPRDATDRNRTSPFAFTGNKFEFRAPGSSQACSGANVILNTIVAEAMDDISAQLEKAGRENFNEKLQKVLQSVIKKHKRIIFNGDNYTEDWRKEAEKRGLPNLVSTPEALAPFLWEKNELLMEKYGVFTKHELRSRHDVFEEEYSRKVKIEGELSLNLARTLFLPAASKQLKTLADTISNMNNVGLKSGMKSVVSMAERIGKLADAIEDCANRLEKNLAAGKPVKILDEMHKMRVNVDVLEKLVDDDLWPLPKYREMLFIL